ncbi:MAG: ParB N-terminal domain-containing protein [Phycisphaerales bacterium]|nr:ParB N-terminal domain-containing protein [Phycisphaerales bacterium]
MPDPVLQRVPIDLITLEPQPRARFDPEALRDLAASIAASGLQQPPLCRRNGDRLILVDGERRLRASRSLGWKEIPVLVATDELDAAEAADPPGLQPAA